jgi:hypothetical protein
MSRRGWSMPPAPPGNLRRASAAEYGIERGPGQAEREINVPYSARSSKPDERYGYVFEGNSQDLVISPGLEAALVPGSVDVVHVNAEFAEQARDHDLQLARFLVSAT